MPEQQVIVFPLVEESFAFPPLVPSLIGSDCAPWLSTTAIIFALALPDLLESDCSTAVIVTVEGLGICEGAV